MRVLATLGRLDFRYGRKLLTLPRALISALLIIAMLTTLRAAWAPPVPPPFPVGGASGSGCFNCGCHGGAMDQLNSVIITEHIATRTHITIQFELHRYAFVVDYWFRLYVLYAMMLATRQATSVALAQMEILGTLFDAKEQLEAQRTFDILKAEAHRDYHPSMDMCVVGTFSRGLAATQRRGAETAHVMSQRFLDRQINSANTNAAEGRHEDREGRFEQFVARFCSRNDNNYVESRAESGLAEICNQTVDRQHLNKDIDYGRMVDAPMTINADFTNSNITAATESDEEAILALASNLYGHDVLDPPAPHLLEVPANRPLYIDVRAIAAKRSVAQNSFTSIVGMKTNGSETGEETRGYMRMLLQQMGVTDDAEIQAFLGRRPSYHAQMELLTKKLYQRPEFYTNLYTSDANIARTQASMRAIGLMQNFDLFKSRLRNEAMMAVLVELELETEQGTIEDESGAPEMTGDRN